MKVASGSRLNLREAFVAANLRGELSDDELDEVIVSCRSKLNELPRVDDLYSESSRMVEALQPLLALACEKCEDSVSLDSDQWGNFLWDGYCACTSNTRAASRCTELNSNMEAWMDMVTLLLASPEEREAALPIPTFSRFRVSVGCMFVGFCMALGTFLPLSNLAKVRAALGSALLFILGEVWRRIGFDMTRARPVPKPGKSPARRVRVEEVALSSASSHLRVENEELRRRLEELEKGELLPPPAGAPPIPPPAHGPRSEGVHDAGRPSVFMRAAQAMTAGGGEGPMLEADAEPLLEEGLTDLLGKIIKLKGFLKQPQLNGQLAVVTDASTDRLDVKIKSGQLLKGISNVFWERVQGLGGPEGEEAKAPLLGLASGGTDGALQPELIARDTVYAPLDAGLHAKTKHEAKKIRESLGKWHRSLRFWVPGSEGSGLRSSACFQLHRRLVL